ncbi:MAG: 3-hydroxyacyl-ACP dehydratase FabZ [Candidatus Sumerlaeia bacterium]
MTESKVEMNVEKICEIIPHRYPFLLVDRVIKLNMEEKVIIALKNVTMNEPFFEGHFPGAPVMPGVLQIEALAQTAAIYMLSIPENAGKIPFFAAIDNVKFRRQVVPGDQLRLEIKLLRLRSRLAKAEAKAYVGDELSAEAVLTCMLGDKADQ